jgi:hypothetical protein
MAPAKATATTKDIKANVKELLFVVKTNEKYKQEIRRFLEWCLTTNQPGPPYLRRVTVDCYFESVVLIDRATICHDSAQGIVRGLQFYANEIEHPGDPGFEVQLKNPRSVVTQALYRRDLSYITNLQLTRMDPHEGLPTDVLTFEDHRRVLSYLFGPQCTESTWDEFSLSWCIDYASYLRIDSLRKIRFCDLLADEAHGPVSTGPNATILAIILQPYMHKDQTASNPANNKTRTDPKPTTTVSRCPIGNSKKRVVGLYRSRHFIQCGTGHLARSFCMRLYDALGFSFLEQPMPAHTPASSQPAVLRKNVKPTWHTEMVLQNWSHAKSLTTISKAYNRVLDATDTSFNHVTHLRSSGIERGSTAGLCSSTISTMSKHMTDKLNKYYMTELLPTVMSLMAGFGKDEPYFLPRSEVEIPYCSNNVYIRHVFPQYDRWLEEFSSEQGDKSKIAANNFLYKMIPFLARVVIQDAPYWLKYHPQHDWSVFLNSKVFQGRTDYKLFLSTAIARASQLSGTRQGSGLRDLNEATRYVFLVYLFPLHF